MAKIEFLAACKPEELKACVTVLWLFNITFQQKIISISIFFYPSLTFNKGNGTPVRKAAPPVEGAQDFDSLVSCMVSQLRRKITDLQILNAKTITLFKITCMVSHETGFVCIFQMLISAKTYLCVCMWTHNEKHTQPQRWILSLVWNSFSNAFLHCIAFTKFKGIPPPKPCACFPHRYSLRVFSAPKFGPGRDMVLVKCKCDWTHTLIYSSRERTVTTVNISGQTTTLVANLKLLELNFASHALRKLSKSLIAAVCPGILGFKFCRYCGEILGVH